MQTADGADAISRHGLVYSPPPSCWQDGFLLGNGGLGALFYAPQALEWVVNKTDVLDGRTREVRRAIPRQEADEMVRRGASSHDFQREELTGDDPEGLGPKSCCHLQMDLGMSAGSGTRTALPAVTARLDLHDATLRVELDKHLCHPRVESFIRSDEDMLVIRVTDVSPIVSFNTRLFFSRPEDLELGEPELWQEGTRLFLRMQMPEAGHYVAALEVIPRPSHAYRDTVLKGIREKYHPPVLGAVQALVRGRFGIVTVGGDFDVYVTVATDRDADDPAAEVRARLDRAAAVDVTDLHAAHRAWWDQFWSRSCIELGDEELEALYHRSLYALASTFRKAPLAGSCGLAYGPSVGPLQYTPWNGDLHQDLNVQCPFFGVHAANHSELFDAYLESYHEFLPEGQRLAREVWQAEGAQFDMCFTTRGKSVMGGLGTYRYFFGGSYVALMHCRAWQYRRDLEQMRERIYPFLREVLAFYRSMMTLSRDGRYHLVPAHAAEIDITDTGDPVQVIAMLRVCLETAIEGAGLLSVDADLVTGWQDLLAHLPEYPRGADWRGREVVVDGTGIPADHHTGQAGCLHPVFPCAEVDEFSDADVLALYARTLDSVLEKTAETSYAAASGHHYKCVWQVFFRAMTALRLGRVEEFWGQYLPMFMRCFVKPSGLVSHDACVIADPAASEANLATIPQYTLQDVGEAMPTFEPWCGHEGFTTPNATAKALALPLIEASGDFITMITETLLQSHNGIIRVFPGWPGERDAAFEGLVAEGAVVVSARQRDGAVEYLALERRAGCVPAELAVRVKSPWTGEVEMIELAPGQSVRLEP